MKITSARDGSNKVPLDAPLPPLFRSRLSFLDGGFPGELPEGTHPRFDAITFCNIQNKELFHPPQTRNNKEVVTKKYKNGGHIASRSGIILRHRRNK